MRSFTAHVSKTRTIITNVETFVNEIVTIWAWALNDVKPIKFVDD